MDKDWVVLYHDDFASEVLVLQGAVRIELLAHAEMLEFYGPSLGRPYADTLKGSKHSNMKELRFNAGGGVWRLAYAFDPQRQAILLVAGDKKGVNEKRFYKKLIAVADKRYTQHLEDL